MGRLRRWLTGRDNEIEISENAGVRHLHSGGAAIQSAMRLSAPDRLELHYTRAMMSFLLFCPQPREVLMVGLGGGSIARLVHQRMPKARVTVAEINPEMVATARKFFQFPADDKRLAVLVGDGAVVVPRRPASADVLLLDAFEDGERPGKLRTQAFYGAAFAALRDPGVLVANFMADDARVERCVARIEKSFGRRVLRIAALDGVNLIVFAFRGGPTRITWAELKERALVANTLYGVPLEKFFPSLRALNEHTSRYLNL